MFCVVSVVVIGTSPTWGRWISTRFGLAPNFSVDIRNCFSERGARREFQQIWLGVIYTQSLAGEDVRFENHGPFGCSELEMKREPR